MKFSIMLIMLNLVLNTCHRYYLDSGRESGGGGGGGGGGRGGWSPSTSEAMNIYSMKLFNNLIKNTLLAPMFCGLVKS